MRRVIRCSECYSEGANVISLINPAREHYCGAACLYKGQEKLHSLDTASERGSGVLKNRCGNPAEAVSPGLSDGTGISSSFQLPPIRE
jgi:hypothetical protein